MKKVLAMVLSVALLASLAIGGTVAYLSNDDGAVNVMSVGNVFVEQHEQQRVKDRDGKSQKDTNGKIKLENYDNNRQIVPAVWKEQVKEEVVIGDYTLKMRDQSVRNYVDKIVTATNTGTTGAYIRTIFAIPEALDVKEVSPETSPGTDGAAATYTGFDTDPGTNAVDQWLHWNGVSDNDTTKKNGWFWGKEKDNGEWPDNANDWYFVDNVEIEVDGEKRVYDIYVATNKNVIKAGETTAPSFLGFYIDKAVDNEKDADGNIYYTFKDKNGDEHNLGDITKLNILVMTQAVQAEGFTDAWAALDDVFGPITKTSHPWINGAESDTVKVSTSDELKKAFAAAATAGKEVTIKLENDIALDGTLTIPAGADVVLNMNGKKISMPKENFAQNSEEENAGKGWCALDVAEGSTLVIDGNGTIDMGENYYASLLYPQGIVTINSGTFTRATGGTSYCSMVPGVQNSDQSSTRLIINGGYFDGGFYDANNCQRNGRMVVNISPNQYARINGGTFVAQNPAWGDENFACPHNGQTDAPHDFQCHGWFFDGQPDANRELPDGFSVTTGTTDDGRPTYTVHYNP